MKIINFIWPPFFDSRVTLPKHFSVNQPTGLENHFFTFINVSKLYVFHFCAVVAATRARRGCGLRYCMRTIWRWMTMDKNTQLKKII
jgi:hypothetical protein